MDNANTTKEPDLFGPFREGVLNITVPVPVEKFKSVYDVYMDKVFEPSIIEAEEVDEDTLRVMCAVFDTILNSLPITTSGFANLLLETGCRNTIRDIFEREFGATTSDVDGFKLAA